MRRLNSLASLRFTSKLSLSLALAAGAALLFYLAFASFRAEQASAQQPPLSIVAGAGQGTTFGNIFTPAEVTVQQGSSVTWTIGSDEVHSITFGQGPQGAPPPLWPNTFNIPPGPPPFNQNLGSAVYTGTEFINTGLIGTGSKVTVQFNAQGGFSYVCVIHPGMKGTVKVVAAGAQVTTQAQADSQIAADQAKVQSAVAPLEEQTKNTVVKSEARADGTKLWTVAVNAFQPNITPGGFIELAKFIPADITVKPGDTVRWVATLPHTVTFLEPGQNPATLDPLETAPAKPSDVYDGKSFYNSGVFLFGPPPQADSFELTFKQAGEYKYLCLLHWGTGQTGTVKVAAAAPGPAAPAGPPRTGIGALSNDGTDWASIGMIGAGLAMLAAIGAIAVSRAVKERV